MLEENNSNPERELNNQNNSQNNSNLSQQNNSLDKNNEEIHDKSYENNQATNPQTYENLDDEKVEHEGLGRAGAIINIICASFLLIFLFWTIIYIGIGIWVLVSNSRYLKGKNNKVNAGIAGLFVSFLGGIFILVSK